MDSFPGLTACARCPSSGGMPTPPVMIDESSSEVDYGVLAAVVVVDVVVGRPVVLPSLAVEEVPEPIATADGHEHGAGPADWSGRHWVAVPRPVVEVTDHRNVGLAVG